MTLQGATLNKQDSRWFFPRAEILPQNQLADN